MSRVSTLIYESWDGIEIRSGIHLLKISVQVYFFVDAISDLKRINVFLNDYNHMNSNNCADYKILWKLENKFWIKVCDIKKTLIIK